MNNGGSGGHRHPEPHRSAAVQVRAAIMSRRHCRKLAPLALSPRRLARRWSIPDRATFAAQTDISGWLRMSGPTRPAPVVRVGP
jgi:hypothetical protein